MATTLAYQLHCLKCDAFTTGYAYKSQVYCPTCKNHLHGIYDVALPFGKHKGRAVFSLSAPAELRYLDWFLLNVDDIRLSLRVAILNRLGHIPWHDNPPMPWWAVLLELSYPFTPAEVKTAYRALSKRFHPDLGGSVEQMQLLNEARQQANAYFDF